jgi:TrpR family transcriptional regulator, trp operon repressor
MADGKTENREKEELINVLAKVAQDKKLLADFLGDLMSPTEYKEAAKRWQIVRQLQEGVPQQRVAEDLGVAIGTVTRGSRALQNETGGFNKVISRYG